MIEDILFPVTHTQGDDAALAAAIALAAHFGTHLTVIEPIALPMPFPEAWWAIPNIQMSQVYGDLRDEGVAHAARLRERIDKEAISCEVRIVESFLTEPPQLVALHARYADLCVLPVPTAGSNDLASAREFFGALLFESGRPLLVVPQGPPPVLPMRHVVVAWQPTREASRALHDALALIKGATSVDVVVVDPLVGETRHGAISLVVRDGRGWAVREIPLADIAKAVVQVEFSPPAEAELELATGLTGKRADRTEAGT